MTKIPPWRKEETAIFKLLDGCAQTQIVDILTKSIASESDESGRDDLAAFLSWIKKTEMPGRG